MANWWSLKVISGPDAGKSFDLKKDRTVIGRAKGDVVLKGDAEASSIHAEITFDNDKGVLILHDLRSRNGSRVNGEKVERRALVAGDRLKFGTTEMILDPPTSEETVVQGASRPQPAAAPAAAEAKAATTPAPAATPAAAAAKSAEKSPEKKPQEEPRKRRRPRPSEEELMIEEPPHLEFVTYFQKFHGVVFHPGQFFDFIARPPSVRPAVNFALITWVLATVLSICANLFFTHVMTSHAAAPVDATPIWVTVVWAVLAMLAWFIVLPIIAGFYHFICLFLGGKAPFSESVQIFCYLTALSVITALAGALPRVGPFASLLVGLYFIYGLTLAAIRLYYITITSSFMMGGFCSVITVVVSLWSMHSASTMRENLARFNPELGKSIGATIVVTPPADPAEQRDPAASAPAAPVTPAAPVPPAAQPAPAAVAPTTAEPASGIAPEAAPPAQPPANTDPQPPSAPANNGGGDPEMPSLPQHVE